MRGTIAITKRRWSAVRWSTAPWSARTLSTVVWPAQQSSVRPRRGHGAAWSLLAAARRKESGPLAAPRHLGSKSSWREARSPPTPVRSNPRSEQRRGPGRGATIEPSTTTSPVTGEIARSVGTGVPTGTVSTAGGACSAAGCADCASYTTGFAPSTVRSRARPMRITKPPRPQARQCARRVRNDEGAGPSIEDCIGTYTSPMRQIVDKTRHLDHCSTKRHGAS